MTKRQQRQQAQKPNRHQTPQRVRNALDLRNGSRTSRHVVRTDERSFRKYGIRSVKD